MVLKNSPCVAAQRLTLRGPLCYLAGLFVVICPGTQSALALDESESTSMETILSVWKEREHRVRGARVTWQEERTEKEGWMLRSKTRTAPATDLHITAEGSLLIDGARRRYAYRRSNWDNGPDYRGPEDRVSVFDGTTARYFAPPAALMGFPNGRIERVWCDEDAVELDPIRVALRPFSYLSGPERGFQVALKGGVVQNRRCMVLDSSKGLRESIWVDPYRQFAVLRYVLYHQDGNSPAIEFSISYDNNPEQDIPVPSGWRLSLSNPGSSPFVLSEATVTACDINPHFATEQFTLDFPVDTRVTDLTGDKEIEYIVRADGDHRPVHSYEWSKVDPDDFERSVKETYMEIRDSPPPGLSKRGWLFYVLLGLVPLCAISIFILLRHRAKVL